MIGRRPPTERSRVARQVDAELDFHHRSTVDELIRSGLDRDEAEAEARRRFGSRRTYRERLIRLDLDTDAGSRWRRPVHVLAVSLRAFIRDLRRSPGFTLGVMALLTLGLGVNAITFGLVDRLVLTGPAGIASPGELRRAIWYRTNASGASTATTELGYLEYQDLGRSSLLAGVAAESATPLLVGSGEAAERVQALLVTASYFPLLGVSPAVGRFFTASESEQLGERLVVLGYAFWQRRFGGDPDAIGRVLTLGDHRYTIIGVAPRHFTGSSALRTDVFLPLEAASDEQVSGPWRTNRNFRWMSAVVRLASGTTDTAAAAEASAGLRQNLVESGSNDRADRVAFAPLNAIRGATASNDLGVAALVGTVAFFVLLIAFANVANLFLARALRRRDRMAVRLALGGTRWRLIGEEAASGALVALVGAVLAVLIASVGATTVQRLLFPDVAWFESAVDIRLLLALAGVAVVGGALVAALPMWQAGRADFLGWLKGGAERGPRARTRTQAVLLVVQGALSVLLLVGAGLFVRSLIEAQSADLGLDSDRLLGVGMISGETPIPSDFQERLRDQVERIPGVERTTRVGGTTPFVSSWAEHVEIPGLPERPRIDDGGPYIHAVEPGYFDVVGTTIVEGRPFTDRDRPGAPRVVIVNETMARLYWPGETAIGKCMQIGPVPSPCSTVVGVAENTRRQEILEGDSLLYYVPMGQAPDNLVRMARLVIRVSSADTDVTGRVAETVRREALAIAPGLRYVSVRSLDDVVSPQLRTWRLGAGLFSSFGVLALVVATIGLYSVVVFDVEGRRREMGIRSALGATSTSLLGLVVRNGVRTAAGGIALGLLLSWLLAPVVASLLYGVPAQDGATFVGVAAVLTVAAIVASVIPGLRAAHVDPSAVLRDE